MLDEYQVWVMWMAHLCQRILENRNQPSLGDSTHSASPQNLGCACPRAGHDRCRNEQNPKPACKRLQSSGRGQITKHTMPLSYRYRSNSVTPGEEEPDLVGVGMASQRRYPLCWALKDGQEPQTEKAGPRR